MDKNPWESQQDSDFIVAPVASRARKASTAWDIHYRRILSVWPWMIPAGLLFLAAAWFYLRYQDDVYKVSASIVLQDPSTFQVVNMYSNRDPINDNIARLRSPTLMKRVVDTMGLQYQAKVVGNIKDRFLYDEVKWKILNATPGRESSGLMFEVETTERGFRWKSGNQTGEAAWDIPFSIGNRSLVLSKKASSVSPQFICFEADPWGVAFQLTAQLSINSSKISNVVELSLQDIQRQRAVDIINTLIQIYNYSLLIDKRKSQEQALKFISERLEPLAFQVDSIESVLAQFKSEKGMILRGEFLSRVLNLDDELSQFRLQQSILNYSENYLRNPATQNNQLSLPGVQDANTQQLINSLLALWAEREKLALTVTENNPKLQMIDKQIAEVRENLNKQIENYKKIGDITEDVVLGRKGEFEKKFNLTPFEEKRLNEILRFQKIKLDQFLDLLKKKEDAGIALASVAVETFVIRPALIPKAPIGPDRFRIMLTAFLIGIWIPFLVVLIMEFLNDKIVSKQQLQQMLTPPILAELDLVEKKNEVLHIKRRDRSIFGEQVRSLRTALRYYMKENKPFFVLITSSMSGEGKSFLSANLAASFALQGKRVALLEFDLRRPKLSKQFGYAEQQGISTILIGKTNPGDVTFRIQDDGILDLFPAGPVPPNPSELMSLDRMQEFKAYLDQHYDVVIMDTPPNGIVSDAQLLQPWADITLVITRFRLTVREQVREIEEWYQGGMFQPMGILFNGVSVSGYYGNKYSYYYHKRKYGYKYYSSKESLGKEEGTSS